MSGSVSRPRFHAVLLGAFAGVAGVLTVVGVERVLAWVRPRTREIGIRMALGARRWQVLAPVMGRGLLLTIAGLVSGLAIASASERLLRGILLGVEPLDRLTLVAVSLLLGGVAAIASYVPARSATNVDPMVALRHDSAQDVAPSPSQVHQRSTEKPACLHWRRGRRLRNSRHLSGIGLRKPARAADPVEADRPGARAIGMGQLLASASWSRTAAPRTLNLHAVAARRPKPSVRFSVGVDSLRGSSSRAASSRFVTRTSGTGDRERRGAGTMYVAHHVASASDQRAKSEQDRDRSKETAR